MITSPFDLKRHLSEPERRFDTVPLLDLCLIGLFFALYSSRFILASGVMIDLPQADVDSLSSLTTTAVLTAYSSDMILFEGQVFRAESLQPKLSSFLQEKQSRDAVLLLKVHKNIGAQQILHLCDLARRSGFARVQLAAEEKKPQNREIFSTKR